MCVLLQAGAVGPLVKLLAPSNAPSCQEEAAGTLMNLAACDANKAKLISGGAVAPLVVLLTKGTNATQEHAAGCLANLANGHDDNQAAIGKAGAIEPLVGLLAATGGGEPGMSNGAAARAASALVMLCLRKDNGDAVCKLDGVAKLTASLKRGVAESAAEPQHTHTHVAHIPVSMPCAQHPTESAAHCARVRVCWLQVGGRADESGAPVG